MLPDSGQAWIIGASQGIGLELARVLSEQGWTLTLSARSAGTLEEVAQQLGAQPLAFDATDKASTRQAAQEAFAQHTPNLVLLNVGDYEPMSLEQFDSALFEKLAATNFLSGVYLLEAVVPLMRESGGQILLNASAASLRGLPNSAPYSAPKAALVHMAESLAPELARQNIRLRVINHGFVRSRLTEKNRFPMPFLMEPRDAAERIANAIRGGAFEISFPRRLLWPLKLMRCLPYRLYFAMVNRWILS